MQDALLEAALLYVTDPVSGLGEHVLVRLPPVDALARVEHDVAGSVSSLDDLTPVAGSVISILSITTEPPARG